MAMSDLEKQALKETMAERAKARKKLSVEEFEAEVVEKIAKMDPNDRVIAENIHALVKLHAPTLQAKTWYGMQAYCDPSGKTVMFFQDSAKFKSRYSTLGFQDAAHLDDGEIWPTSFAITFWNETVAKKVIELIKQAVA